MKKVKRSRYLSIKAYIAIFLTIAVIGVCQMLIYFSFLEEGIDSNYIIAPLLGSYLIFMSFLVGIIIVVIRYVSYEKPMRQLSKAIEQVALGDFGVRLPVQKKTEGKDSLNSTFQDFNKMVEELNSIETLKDDFIANVSHEIKTPLSIIQSYALLLQNKEITEEEQVEYTQTIISASHRLSGLVSNILKLNKLENQEIQASYHSFDLSEQLRRCLLGFEDVWEKKQIQFRVDLEEIHIPSDEGMLELVWNNLISNAIKYTDEGGHIQITLQQQENNVVVSIQDTGCGMKKEMHSHIFDKFYQGDTSHSENGNGLGLTLVKKVIEILDGKVYVESEEGKGTTFFIHLKQ